MNGEASARKVKLATLEFASMRSLAGLTIEADFCDYGVDAGVDCEPEKG